jgi:hypothetical protein
MKEGKESSTCRNSVASGLLLLLLNCTAGHAVERYVSLQGGHVPPFTDWSSAATNIQEAIDASVDGDVIWVTNGVYAVGGKVMAGDLTNRVALDKALTMRSVNGPFVTTIQGNGATNGNNAVRCAWLTNGATLVGFTLQDGATRTSGSANLLSGGGAWSATNAIIANCVIRSNTAFANGGGAFQGGLRNCLIIGNKTQFGAGAYNSVLTSCTVVSNSGIAIYGSPATQARLTNCIVYYNNPDNYFSAVLSYCCTTPLPAGAGNISTAPQFLPDGFHLSSTSPCRGAGTNLVSGTDLDGQPWADPPSIGCDEWQPSPLVVARPTIQPVKASAEFIISASAVGQEPFWCLWTRNGVPVEDGANYGLVHTTNLLVRNASLMLDGQFKVIVSNAFGMATSAVAQLTVHCVDAGGNMSTPPFTSWATAATNIQDAINVAAPGELVLVTNGVYSAGGKVMAGDLTNRVALDKAIIVHSVNGPGVTVIQGQWDPTTTNGPGAVRGAWLTNGATLSGFTLQGGATRNTGDTFTQQSGGGVWCWSTEAFVTNCVIGSNSAEQIGAGAYSGFLNHCVISNNIKLLPNNNGGGGAANSVLLNCSVTGNFAGNGGGIYQSTATNCVVFRNSANMGGGAHGSSLYNCTITENTANVGAAGLNRGVSSVAINCVVWNNRTRTGGLANYSTGVILNYCCTSPLPAGGTGNISADPQLLPDMIHLAATSPCRGAGNPLYSFGLDVDGQSWANPPSIGCDEWQPEPIVVRQPRPRPTAGVGRVIISTSVAGEEPFSWAWTKDRLALQGGGHYSSANTSDLVINGFGLDDAGGYQVVVSNAFGMATSQVVQVSVHCVDASGATPVPPYSTWTTAAATIQDAIEAAKAADVILVTNGIYAAGGKVMSGTLTNRVALDKAVLVSSVNGPEVTIIEGQWDLASTNGPGAVRCAWMTNEAGLSGFTLRNGATLSSSDNSGGGVWCASTNAELANCVITNCSAAGLGGGARAGTLNVCLLVGNLAGSGGGASESVMSNCRIARNIASFDGGGVSGGILYNCWLNGNTARRSGGGADASHLITCTVTENSASFVGGSRDGRLTNCIVYFNSAPVVPNQIGTLAYSCTTPPVSGVGNISSDPQLTDGVHLAATSPCRGMGSSLAVIGTDFEGDPWANPPSMGCDEVVESAFAGPLSVGLTAAYPEVVAYGAMPLIGQVIGRASHLEWSFGDGPIFTNLSYLASHAWTDPGDYTVTLTAFNADNPEGVSTNLIVHVVPLVSPQLSAGGLSGTNFSLSFPGQPGVTYVVEQTTNLVPPVTWQTVQSVLSTGAWMQITDTRATNAMRFYRVRTQ